jgi:cation transport regulator ChaB
MPYASNAELPEAVRTALPAAGQSTWRTIFNAADKQYPDDEDKAFATAWAGLRRAGWSKDSDGKWHKVEKLLKFDSERQYVFGWASVAVTKSGEVVEDLQGDIIDVDDLEEAAYQFALAYRESGVMHEGDAVGQLIESFVVTPEKLEAMGLPGDSLPQGLWVGFHVPDGDVFKRIREGDFGMFSIQGSAIREEV